MWFCASLQVGRPARQRASRGRIWNLPGCWPVAGSCRVLSRPGRADEEGRGLALERGSIRMGTCGVQGGPSSRSEPRRPIRTDGRTGGVGLWEALQPDGDAGPRWGPSLGAGRTRTGCSCSFSVLLRVSSPACVYKPGGPGEQGQLVGSCGLCLRQSRRRASGEPHLLSPAA